MVSVSLTFSKRSLYFTENPLPKPQPSSLTLFNKKFDRKLFLAFRNGQKERERKKRKNYRRKRLEEGSNHRPINRKSFKPSTGPRGTRRLLAVEELIFFFRWFSFEFVLALGDHPAWNNFIIPSKHVKTLKQGSSAEFSGFRPRDRKRSQWKQILPQHVDLLLLHWVKVYRKEPSAFNDDEHSRECTMFHFGIYRYSSRHEYYVRMQGDLVEGPDEVNLRKTVQPESWKVVLKVGEWGSGQGWLRRLSAR